MEVGEGERQYQKCEKSVKNIGRSLVSDTKASNKQLTENKGEVNKSNQNKGKEMEDCWKLGSGISR